VGFLIATDVEQFEQEGLALLEGLPDIFLAGLPAVCLAGLTLLCFNGASRVDFVKPN